MSGGERRLLVDASVFITLADIGETGLLSRLEGQPWMPATVMGEVSDDPASRALSEAHDDWMRRQDVREASRFFERCNPERAAAHLGKRDFQDSWDGDVALLTSALAADERGDPVVVITDDKPLRKTCKALSIPVSGSIGVLIRAVERGDVSPEVAKEKLYAMDEVGTRLSASLVKRAERMIDEAAEP